MPPSTLLARPSRIALPFAALFALLAVAISGIAVSLVGSAVEDRIRDQLRATARLAGRLELSPDAIAHLASYIRADIVLATGKRVRATNLAAAEAREIERALEAGTLPAAEGDVRVAYGSYGSSGRHLVAAARLADGRSLYLLFPEALESDERARATRPVLVVSIVGVALTALLGALKERSQVRERTRALERLVSALAHEVKNPLGAIGLTVETLRDAVPGPREREAIDIVASEVERLGLLVDELRVVSGHRPFKPEPVSARESVESVLALLRRTIEHRSLVLDEGEVADRRVLVDPRGLKQALLNLLLNAIEASPRGGAIRVRVSARGDSERSDGGGIVRFEVADEGPGVPEAMRGRLFEPFATTKEGGTGLGLALARRIAEEHGGTLELVPAPRGATFALELPGAPA